MLEVAALQYLGAMSCERACDHQLVEELVDQDAGLSAVLQSQGLAIHRAEILLHQEAGEAQCAVGVPTGSVQRVQQCLQADVAHEVIIYFICVGVAVVFLRGVGLTTHHTQGCRAGLRVLRRVWLAHGQLRGLYDRKPPQKNSISSG